MPAAHLVNYYLGDVIAELLDSPRRAIFGYCSKHTLVFFSVKEATKRRTSPRRGSSRGRPLRGGSPRRAPSEHGAHGPLLHAQLPLSPRAPPFSFPLTQGRGAGTERGGAPTPGEGEGHEAEDSEAEEGYGVRPVEKLQRDVLHLLLVDHAEVQAVVHVVLAQGPAPHARRHLDPFPSARPGPARPTRARRHRRRGESRRARRAEGRTQLCRSPTRREKAGGGRSEAEPTPGGSGGTTLSPLPPLSPLPSGLARAPILLLPPAPRRGCWAGRPMGVESGAVMLPRG